MFCCAAFIKLWLISYVPQKPNELIFLHAFFVMISKMTTSLSTKFN